MNSLMTLVDAETNTFAANFGGTVYSCTLPTSFVFDIIDVEWEEEVLEVYTGWVEVTPRRVIDPYTGNLVM
jgi:hypothetical protein